jgi:hypothetical protein
MQEVQRKGGKIGRKRSPETMTHEERTGRTRKASGAGAAVKKTKKAAAKNAANEERTEEITW